MEILEYMCATSFKETIAFLEHFISEFLRLLEYIDQAGSKFPRLKKLNPLCLSPTLRFEIFEFFALFAEMSLEVFISHLYEFNSSDCLSFCSITRARFSSEDFNFDPKSSKSEHLDDNELSKSAHFFSKLFTIVLEVLADEAMGPRCVMYACA